MRPSWKSTIALIVLGVVLLAMSGIGQPQGYLKDLPSWLGDIGWFGMLACLLLLIVSGVWAAALRMTHRDTPAAH